MNIVDAYISGLHEMKGLILSPEHAANQFAALAHETRLMVFRTVMRSGPDGVSAGDLASRANVTPSNLSAHLTVLVSSGLLEMRRDGRHRYYSPTLASIRALINYLLVDCCDGNPDVCDLSAEISAPSKDLQSKAG